MLKKTILISGLILYTLANVFAQVCTVKGNIIGFKEKSFPIAYSISQKDGAKQDMVPVKDGKINWTGKINQPTEALLYLPGSTIFFFMEPGNIKISGNADSLSQLKITGSKTQAEYDAYKKLNKPLYKKRNSLELKIANTPAAGHAELKAQLDKLTLEIFETGNQYIRKHPNSFVSLFTADKGNDYPYAWNMESFNMLGNTIRNNPAGKYLAYRLMLLKRRQIGEQIPDFVQNNPEGKPVRLSNFKGKYVFVDFWASSCGPCRAETPNLLKAYNKFKANNFTIIGVSLDDKKASWEKAIKDDGMPWAQVSDLKGWKNKVSSYYGIGTIPSNLLVDPSGKVIAKDLHEDDLYNKLAQLFNSTD